MTFLIKNCYFSIKSIVFIVEHATFLNLGIKIEDGTFVY